MSPEHDPTPPPEPTSETDASRPSTNGVADEEMERLREEVAAAKDHALRAAAELDNVRKRTRRELEEERRYAHLDLLRDLLPVLDNLERAIQAAEGAADAAGLLAGVKMVQQQLAALLERYRCRRIATVGAAFDPHLHEALSLAPAPEQPPHTILQEVRSGYQLHDRVVRPAQVILSAPPLEISGDGATASG
jgi:molecular chaperone GrpE